MAMGKRWRDLVRLGLLMRRMAFGWDLSSRQKIDLAAPPQTWEQHSKEGQIWDLYVVSRREDEKYARLFSIYACIVVRAYLCMHVLLCVCLAILSYACYVCIYAWIYVAVFSCAYLYFYIFVVVYESFVVTHYTYLSFHVNPLYIHSFLLLI